MRYNYLVANTIETTTQKNHYYPFGTASAEMFDNGTNQPYKYNGKELDQMHGLNLYDYSARYYESAIGRFTSVDPLAEKFYSISPYVYCANNPIKFIDPTGMVIDSTSLAEWSKLKDDILDTMADLNLKKNGGWKKNTGRIAGLLTTLSGMKKIEESEEIFSLNKIGGEEGGVTFKEGKVVIGFTGTANFVHEVTHGIQYLKGDIGFTGNKTIGQDLFDEVDAYKAQYNYAPSSVHNLNSSSRINNTSNITPLWVQNITKSDGSKPYSLRGSANVGTSVINKNSTYEDFKIAYSHWPSWELQGIRFNGTIGSSPNFRFK